MSFWKSKSEKTLIPPVTDVPQYPRANSYSGGNSASPRPTNRSNSSTNVDGDSYRTPSSRSAYNAPQNDEYSAPINDRYNRNKPVGDRYTRGEGQLDEERNELFSGYNAEKVGAGGRFFDGPPPRKEPTPGEEDEEDVEGIKQQTRFVKQESVNSSRNALRLMREAEETARGTLGRLGDQSGRSFISLTTALIADIVFFNSEKLANTERHLDVSKGHSVRADDKTDELKKLNRSIFRPAITFNKDAKRATQEAKLQSRYDNEREEREKAMTDIRETQNRLGQAATYGRGVDDEEEGIGGSGAGRGRYKTEQQLAERKSERKRFQFESTGSDDELEDELDDNLDEKSSGLKSLKALSLAMGQELGEQNNRIGRIEQKTVGLDDRLGRNTERVRSDFIPVNFDTKAVPPYSSRKSSEIECCCGESKRFIWVHYELRMQ
jgi:hypothetical protein